MSEIDQQFIEYVVKSLVGNPEAVHIDRRIDEKGVLLELTVDPEDLGRVIGKRGATAQSLRTLLRALGTKNDARYNLKIVDNGTPSGAQSSDSSSRADDSSSTPSPSTQDQPAEDAAVSTVDDESVKPAPETEEPEAEEPEEAQEAPTESQASDRLQKAREELADLDDLDV